MATIHNYVTEHLFEQLFINNTAKMFAYTILDINVLCTVGIKLLFYNKSS